MISIAEGIAIYSHHRLTGRGLAPEKYALNLLSGLCLMLAIRSVSGTIEASLLSMSLSEILLPACLFAAGIAHWADVYGRWKDSNNAYTTRQSS
jgi:hypothetical protein